MLEFFRECKPLIDRNLKRRLGVIKNSFSRVNHWGADVCRRLERFTLSGKTLRGGLVLLSFYLNGGKKSSLPDALDAAAAIELAQSSFLIHDDIMDRDIKRRGKSSFFYQYKELGDKFRFGDPYHFGESLGICAGDIGFFMGYGMLSGLKTGPAFTRNLAGVFSRELSYVALAQMQDVFAGYQKSSSGESAILKVYLYKTGRYTFSLPLMLGAMLAGRTEKQTETLSKIGEKLGIIFQIKDDELGLFGNEKDIGKPVGSDIRENKKNLYHYYLYRSADRSLKKKLDALFGNKNITEGQIEEVRSLVRDKGIQKKLDGTAGKLAAEAEKLIRSLKGVDNKYAVVLLELLQYSTERSK